MLKKYMEINDISKRVINEVAQILQGFSTKSKEQIPPDLFNFFLSNANEKEKYPVDINIPIDKQDLDKDTYKYVALLLNFVKPTIEYVNLEPKWSNLKEKKEIIQQIEKEIATNLFNINNILADRKLEKIEYVYDFIYYGRCFNEENIKKLKPFVALCRIFNIVHKEYQEKRDEDKTLQMYIFITEEIKKNLQMI